MKFLFAIKSIDGEGGGAERVLVDICNGLSRRGHQVFILTFDPPGGTSFFALDASIVRLDMDICVPGKSVPRLSLLLALRRMRHLIDSVGADLVIPFMHSSYVPIALALIGSGAKLVFSEHTDVRHYRSRPVQRWLTRAADRLAVAKTVPSAGLQTPPESSGLQKVHVLPNPVDIDSLSRISRKLPASPPVVLSLGTLRPEKNHIDLVRAFAQVASAFPDWTLRIVGEGELRPQLTTEIAQLGMNERITMPGVTRNVADAYAACSLVVLPSLYESFGLVAAEALAAGRPVISFDNCLGIAEMVQNGHNGLLVKGGASSDERVENLAMGLAQMMADPELRQRLGQAGPTSVQRYALESALDTWEEFLLNTAATAKERCAKKY